MDIELTYGVSEATLSCPKLRTTAPSAYGYAMNSDILRAKEMDIANPAVTPMFFESVDTSRNAVGPPSARPVPGRHRKKGGPGSNLSYCDSSARFVPDSAGP